MKHGGQCPEFIEVLGNLHYCQLDQGHEGQHRGEIRWDEMVPDPVRRSRKPTKVKAHSVSAKWPA